MERKSIGQFIAALRKANGLTQKQLADKLNVSDKAVSRWERDECAPDISLIPVIADIFGVTCDELLCGERKINNDSSSANDEVLSAKGEKQRRRILAVGLSQYRNRSLIAIGIALVGLIAAAICNFAFFRARLGFMIGVIFFIAAVICQAIFLNKALLSVTDDEFSDDETGTFKKKVINLAEFVIGFTVALTAFALSLIYTTWDAYMGIDLAGWLVTGSISTFITVIISYIICVVINGKLSKKGVWEITDKERIKHHNVLVFAICAVGFAVAAGITVLLWLGITDDGYAPQFATGTVFNDYESFAEFMEKDVPDPYAYHIYDDENINTAARDNAYFDNVAEELEDTDNSDEIEYYDPYEDLFFDDDSYGFANNGIRIVIKDASGKILLDCAYNNHSVVYIDCGTEDNGWLPIKVVTTDDLPEGERRLALSGLAAVAIIAVEAGLALFIYFKKREKLN